MPTDPPEFFERLDELARTLEADEDLEVVTYSLGKPISKSALKEVENALGGPLSDELRQFYEHANGTVLHWRPREDIPEARLEALREEYWIEVPENEENPFARINIIPLEKSVVKIDWIGEFAFPAETSRSVRIGSQEYVEADAAQRLKPFDLFTDFACMAYLFKDEGGEPDVLWLTNQYQDWSHSRVTNFSSYLEFLIESRGVCEAREEAYSTA